MNHWERWRESSSLFRIVINDDLTSTFPVSTTLRGVTVSPRKFALNFHSHIRSAGEEIRGVHWVDGDNWWKQISASGKEYFSFMRLSLEEMGYFFPGMGYYGGGIGFSIYDPVLRILAEEEFEFEEHSNSYIFLVDLEYKEEGEQDGSDSKSPPFDGQGTFRFVVDKGTFHLRQIVIESDNRKLVCTFERIEVNIELEESVLEFSPPSNAIILFDEREQ